MRRIMMGAGMAALLAACGPDGELPEDIDEARERGGQIARDTGEALGEAVEEATERGGELVDEARAAIAERAEEARERQSLREIVDDPRRDEDRGRDAYRNPEQTLDFFEIERGDTVIEALPGGGWYARILLPWLDEEGRYYAMNYPMNVFERIFGDGLTDERRAELERWEDDFGDRAVGWGGAADGAFRIGDAPGDLHGEADAVLYIRALHNLARFGLLEAAADEAFLLVRPGGVVGVVQHRAPAGESDARADGSRGYMREADVIAAFEGAGFVLEETSEINANPRDTADWETGVWVLPPSLGGPEEERARMEEIGESDRMTLRFRKPG